MSLWACVNDSHLISILIFFKGELELLRLDCADIFRDEPDAVNEAKLRIAKCHSRYVLLRKNAARLNEYLSPIMFVFLLGCSFIICITVYQINSDALMLGPYESSWWSSDVALRRSTLLLAVQFQQPIVFSAGPFNDLYLVTFVNIIKGAYSYYTLLSQSQA